MKAINQDGLEVDIQIPSYAVSGVEPGMRARLQGRNITMRGSAGQAPGFHEYYDAWYEVDGNLYFPIGDKYQHRNGWRG